MLRAMASVEEHGNGFRTIWRQGGEKRRTTVFPEESNAEDAKKFVEAHHGRVTADEVNAFILGEDPNKPESTAPLLSDFLPKAVNAKTTITPGTKAGYLSDAKNHILPTFGDEHMDRITVIMIGEWINGLKEKGYSIGSITRYFTVLFGCFEAALRERPPLVDENPCRLTDFIRDQVAHDDEGNENAVYLEKAEYKILRAAFPKRYQPLIDLLVGTGMRWSEATAVAVEDLIAPKSRSRAKVRVRRAWKRDPVNGPYIGTTKGRKKRTLPIKDDLYKTTEPLTRDAPPTALLFRLDSGSRIEYGNFYKQVWVPSVAKAMRCANHPPATRGEQVPEQPRRRCRDFGGTRDDGKPCGQWTKVGWTRCVDHIGPDPKSTSECNCEGYLKERPTPHDLRHTHAAWLLSAGIQPVAVQRRLGHERLDTTTETYGGLLPEVDDDIIDAL